MSQTKERTKIAELEYQLMLAYESRRIWQAIAALGWLLFILTLLYFI